MCARSADDIPVLMPDAASTATAIAVPCSVVLCFTIIEMPNRSSSSGIIGTQISPRPWVAMKLIFSAVASCAAMTKSPSFSRSSSSTMITIPPRLMASTARSTAASALADSGRGALMVSEVIVGRQVSGI